LPCFKSALAVLAATFTTILPTTVASAEPAAASPTYRLEINTGRLTEEQTRQLAENRMTFRPSEAPSQRAIAASSDLDQLRTDCNSHSSESGTTPNGWLADRYRQCIHNVIDALVVNDGTNTVAGEISFDYWILIWADRASRQTLARVTIPGKDAVVSTIPGNFIDWPNQHIDLIPTGCTPSLTMTCPIEPKRTLDEWATTPDYEMSFSSANGTGAAPDSTVTNFATYTFQVGTLPVRPGVLPTNYQTNMRFDSGRRMSPANGAVLVEFIPVMQFSLSDPTENQSALHIRDAQLNPLRTFPSWLGKTIPGRAGGSEPLHRLVDDALQAANRAASIAFCKETWGPNYATGGKQCDEYPFCTTYEGAVTGTEDTPGLPPRLSVRPIKGNDNCTSGSRLGVFYTAQRIIDHDAFFVNIAP
jgi:hypothetical protein